MIFLLCILGGVGMGVLWRILLIGRRRRTRSGNDRPADDSSGISQLSEKQAPEANRVPDVSPARPDPAASSGETSPELAIHDLVDVRLLQQVLDVFVQATGLASVVTDIHGVPLTSLANFSDFCMKHTRGTREGAERCQLNDAEGGTEATKTGKPVVYFCHAGLVDFAVPLIVQGKQLGTWLGGQVLPAKPDERKFRRIAREIGVDENEYVQDLRKIKIIPKERIDALANLLSLIANALLQIGYARRVTEEKAAELSDKVIQVVSQLTDGVQEISEPSQKLKGMMKQVTTALRDAADRANSEQVELARLEATMRELEQASRVISDKLKQINKKSEQIHGIIGAISKVADQTNLLSVNAAIQAEKAGEYGLGFGVVANEIRRLADQTAVSALDIERTVNEMHAVVSSGVTQTDGFITDVRRSAGEAVKIGGQLKEAIEQVRVLLPRFEEVTQAVNGQTEMTSNLQQSMGRLDVEMQTVIGLMRQSFAAVDRLDGRSPEARDV